MKCKDCHYCSQRGGYKYFFCDKDNRLIEPNDYYSGKIMNDCVMNRLDDDDFTDDYMMWMIARK